MAIDPANLVVSFLVGTVGAGIAGEIIKRRFTTILEVWRSQRGWKERAVTELLGPVYMQLDRTKRAFDRWDGKNLFLEGEVVRKGNLAIRDLLLEKPHLIPPELRNDASALMQHYDVWLEEFDRVRKSDAPNQPSFVFAGPSGYPFPTSADANFRATFRDYWDSLYASDQKAAPLPTP